MKKSLLGRFLQFLFLLTALLFANKNFAQPGGYALRLESNGNFGTAYVLTNNSPTTGILSTTITAATTADTAPDVVAEDLAEERVQLTPEQPAEEDAEHSTV